MLLKPKHLIKLVRNPSPNDRGFTLIELLVTALIGGVIVSGLLYLTNELLTSDQRESSRTETQRDLNLALDFIGSELREAVYVYQNATCLVDGGATGCVSGDGISLINTDQVTLPDNPGVPVLAFWKQESLNDDLVTACQTGAAIADQVPCIKGNAYSLVVYAFQSPGAEGKSEINRYSMRLTEDTINNDEYATPIEAQSVKFRNWPHGDDTATFSEPELLADFVDDDNGAQPTCPSAEYTATPSAGGADSFYACVKNVTIDIDTSDFDFDLIADGNQDVIIRLRGNAKNRSAFVGEESFLPTLESQYSVRGVLNRQL